LLDGWSEALGAFVADDIREALDAMPRHYTEFPPTLPQFVALCKDARMRRSQTVVRVTDQSPRKPVDFGRIKEMAAGIGVVKPAKSLDWARKVMERAEADERSVPYIAVEFAKDALGIKAYELRREGA